jgi:fucose 4-O-acetylase-like acetyltransferase
MKQRNLWIDSVRGTLIILVVIGHILPAPLNEDTIRQWIYLFHMPLFLALSGYVFPTRSLAQTVSRAWPRYLLPWAIASAAFLAARWAIEGRLPFTLLRAIIEPWYHLWYIPAFFLFSVVAALGQPLGSLGIFGIFMLPIIALNLGFDLLPLLGPFDPNFLYMGIFFGLGLVLRDYARFVPTLIIILVLFAGIAIAVAFGPRFAALPSLGVRLLLSFGTIGLAARIIGLSPPHIEPFSRESLAIYLWHPLPLLVLKPLIPAIGIEAYLALAILTCRVGVPLLIVLLRYVPGSDTYLGKTHQQSSSLASSGAASPRA